MSRRHKAVEINLTEKQRRILSKFARGTHTKGHYKQRAKIILLADKDMSNSAIAREMECQRNIVIKWRKRWDSSSTEINLTEEEHPHNLKSTIKSHLEDAQRPGKPQDFKPEQIAGLINLACQEPKALNLPFSHWTASLLTEEAIKRGIFDSISKRHVGRLLENFDIKPHRCKTWLFAKEKDPEKFKEQAKEVCDTYKKATEHEENGTHVICTDEMCGLQAREHCHPLLPSRPGYIIRYEQEYKRHGTSGIIASRNVVTGEIIKPSIQPTRTEEDFIDHIKNVVKTDSEANYIFVMDQLNTHKSESLVRFVINECNLDIDEKTLGTKGSSGILQSMKTRSEFLLNLEHKIRIVYTPKHSSWLNQIEIWFSIIKRHLLNRRASFKSVKDMENRIQEYIEYYNENLAKPFQWTYSGKLLKA
jgi:transposase